VYSFSTALRDLKNSEQANLCRVQLFLYQGVKRKTETRFIILLAGFLQLYLLHFVDIPRAAIFNLAGFIYSDIRVS